MDIREYFKANVPNGAQILEQIDKDPLLSAGVLFTSVDAPGDLDGSLARIAAFCRTREGAEQLGAALRQTFTGLTLGLGCAAIATSQVPRRPPERDLPEALLAFAEAEDEAGGRMGAVPFDRTRARALAPSIQGKREVVAQSIRFVSTVLRSLAVEEHEAYAMLKGSYDLIRAMAQADPVLLGLLGGVEDYLYGPAQQAVETRRTNAREQAQMQTSAEKKAHLVVEKQVRASLGEQLSALAGEIALTAPLPAPATDPRHSPR
jgi:hypothetical protein